MLPKLNDSPKQNLSAKQAVLYGHLMVNLPVLFIIASACLLGYAFRGPTWAFWGLLLGAIPAWLWWSVTVPRWRDWVKRRGADTAQTQILGERTGLLWPKGSAFEKTEFKRRIKT